MDRPKLERDLDGLQVTVEQLPPRAGMRSAIAAARVFGPTLVELLTAGPVTIGPFRLTLSQVLEVYAGRQVAGFVAKGEAWEPATLSLATHPELVGSYTYLARRVMESLETISPDAVLEISDAMLLGYMLVGRGAEQRRISSAEVLDSVVPDALTMLGILRMALEVNLRPFVRVLATLAAMSPART